MGRAARPRRRELPGAAGLPARALAVLPSEARRRRHRRRARRDRAAAADREGRAARDPHSREPVRRASLRGAARARPDLLDERHDGDAELRPAHRRRPRQLGHRLGAELRRLRDQRGPAHRLDLQRWAVRRGGRTRGLRPDRAHSHPGRHGEHGSPRPRDRAAAARGRRPDAVVRGLPRREPRPPGLERRAGPRRGRARRRRAGLPREARGRLGREGDGGDGDRRHRRLALGRVRGAGRHAPRRPRVRPRRADRPGHGRSAGARRTAPPASSCSRISATAPRRCCASAPATTSRCGRARARAAGRPRACAASAAPTTC